MSDRASQQVRRFPLYFGILDHLVWLEPHIILTRRELSSWLSPSIVLYLSYKITIALQLGIFRPPCRLDYSLFCRRLM